ncbi:TIGR03943 family protein [Frankia sp. CNm7]|uniref:TIGR03943 family protein n=1 Tax=Frankia nepalensis TaxID=1836974 RepID=A0A937UR83_9ACTN|nr:TIGR03943 family protein [Frankia nepalensis]MBL7502322.1 TIGR03943 family protein [Frankia nepalensis]MBL7511363.1 TIGR03943 family protein [Frankia nepalensis]MBL7519205.1 TIGR03943 family protein [Frankia nepalensis]MBL7627466.1 TIGR03943 family protein [Frankia nepalensis]
MTAEPPATDSSLPRDRPGGHGDHRPAAAGERVGPLGGLLLLVVGVTCLRLAQTGAYTSYVRGEMRIPLFATGALVALLGLVALASYVRSGGRAESGEHPDEHEHEHEHGHGRGFGGAPRVALLLVLPVAVVYLVGPPALGAFSASRAAVSVPPPRPVPFTPLSAGADGTVTVALDEAVERAYGGDTLSGHTLRLTGFVVDPDGRKLILTRFVIRCCAADAEPAAITLTLPANVSVPDENTWVTVEARWAGDAPPDGRPGFMASSLEVIEPPADPYET